MTPSLIQRFTEGAFKGGSKGPLKRGRGNMCVTWRLKPHPFITQNMLVGCNVLIKWGIYKWSCYHGFQGPNHLESGWCCGIGPCLPPLGSNFEPECVFPGINRWGFPLTGTSFLVFPTCGSWLVQWYLVPFSENPWLTTSIIINRCNHSLFTFIFKYVLNPPNQICRMEWWYKPMLHG